MQWGWTGRFRVVKPFSGGRGRPDRRNCLVRLNPAAWGGGMPEGQLSGISDHLLPELPRPLGHIKGFGMKTNPPVKLLAVT